ncbi:MAG: ComEC/Rec2 family competence protein [Rhodobacteraceae bacterium]|nr:ComEC/Rec2 family competence protein [Paracoccaceae bacterium]
MPAILTAVEEQRGHLFPWMPIALALGIGLYFALPRDPTATETWASAAGAGLCIIAALWLWRLAALGTVVCLGIGLAALGLVRAETRSAALAGPVLGWHYYGPVEGRVVGLDRSASDRPRITLDQVRLTRLHPDEIPTRVRLSLSGLAAEAIPPPGAHVMTTAHLDQPRGAAEPSGFDFRRHLWFREIGAVGYTRVPVLIAAPPDGTQPVFRIRMALSDALRDRLPGDVGGFAAAVTTGDRSGVSQSALEALRGSNLAHLLAISGLHMGLLAGLLYGAFRGALAAVPWVALRWPLRRVAAIGALIGASFYLALSGGNIATERAFIMVAVALCAVMAERRALSIRAVAVAATIVLLLRPEALLSPGFQMSFAATTALVAVFAWLRDLDAPRLPRWLRGVGALVISSAVAGLATAPIGAAQFNTMSHYGLLANLLSVPVMGMVIMPCALIATALAPLGLEMLALVPMGWGISWILAVADTVAALPGAQGMAQTPPGWVLPVLSLGCLWAILWQGRARWLGVVPVVAALLAWPEASRPEILIEDRGGLVGIMTPEGRALSRDRGAGFVAGIWLENDGDPASQEEAAARWTTMSQSSPAGPITHIAGKRALAAWAGCGLGEVVVTSVPLDRDDPKRGAGCQVITPKDLDRSGAMAWQNGGWVTAAETAGARRWAGQ